MHVENPRYQNEMHDIFFQAAQELGMPKNDNFNDWGQKQVQSLIADITMQLALPCAWVKIW